MTRSHIARTGAAVAALTFSLLAGLAPAAMATPGEASAAGFTAAPVTDPDGTADPAGTDVTWGVRTADNAQGESRQNFLYTVAAGATITDAIVVTNHDDQPLDLSVYAADAFTTDSGQLDVLTDPAASVEAGSWIELGTPVLHLEPGAATEVPFTVTIPQNATPGDHAGGIVTVLSDPDQEDGLTVDRRLGVRVMLRVDGDLAPGLVVENLTLEYTPSLNPFAGGEAVVDYVVHNTGNVRLSGLQSVALYGPFGAFRADIEDLGEVPELLPGESWHVHASSAVYPLFWLGTDVTIAPEGPAGLAGGVIPAMFVTSASVIAVPWGLLVLVLLIAAAVVAGVILTRRTRRARREAEDARVQAAVDAALRERDAAETAETATVAETTEP